MTELREKIKKKRSKKRIYQSKTVNINALVIVMMMIPKVREHIEAHPDILILGTSVINIILRLFTTIRISYSWEFFKPKKKGVTRQ